MENKNMNNELYERIKKYMKDFSTEDLKKRRNGLMDWGEMDNKILNLFNEELLNRACEKIEIEDNKKR